MFDRYTEAARQAVAISKEEAAKLRSPHIETEHLLLGISRSSEPALKELLRLKEVEDSLRADLGATAQLESSRAIALKSEGRTTTVDWSCSHQPMLIGDFLAKFKRYGNGVPKSFSERKSFLALGQGLQANAQARWRFLKRVGGIPGASFNHFSRKAEPTRSRPPGSSGEKTIHGAEQAQSAWGKPPELFF
jgi:hypothetical protein